jgi:hypothetical protein
VVWDVCIDDGFVLDDGGVYRLGWWEFIGVLLI